MRKRKNDRSFLLPKQATPITCEHEEEFSKKFPKAKELFFHRATARNSCCFKTNLQNSQKILARFRACLHHRAHPAENHRLRRWFSRWEIANLAILLSLIFFSLGLGWFVTPRRWRVSFVVLWLYCLHFIIELLSNFIVNFSLCRGPPTSFSWVISCGKESFIFASIFHSPGSDFASWNWNFVTSFTATSAHWCIECIRDESRASRPSGLFYFHMMQVMQVMHALLVWHMM